MRLNSCQKRSFLLLALPVLWLGLWLPAGEAVATTLRVPVEDGIVAALDTDRQLFLEAQPLAGEGLWGLSRRFTGSVAAVATIAESNGGVETLREGVRYRIPYRLLAPDWQLRLVQAVFTQDYAGASGWYHEIGSAAGYGLGSLWHVAEWFTGRGDNYRAIRAANDLADDHLAPGRSLLIPARLLRPALRSALPPESPYYLEYGSDKQGDFAIYRLKPGEALYSSVVIRFTGAIYADDVNALAEEIAERSGIDRVTRIPVGHRIKIPFDLLLPEFLPASDPRRREYEAGLSASAQFSNQVRARRLEGVTVILDSGHGGSDVGASQGDLWESVYVYDIMVRTKELLESATAARVVPLVRDGRRHELQDRDVLTTSRGHSILTEPPYAIADSKVGLHLRWYLANSVYRKWLAEGGDGRKVVFLSIHADSLHPSLRGSMAYIPGAKYRKGEYGRSGPVYASRREVREMPRVSFAEGDRLRSEGLSRDLAGSLIRALGVNGMAVHPDKPIRDKVIRNRKAWVPAVLKYNAVPAKVLLEVCNLANAEDRELVRTQRFRQAVARAIVDGIVEYYGDVEVDRAPRMAVSSR